MKNKSKIIYDLVYNYVEVSENVEKIINKESFQRLKYIKQLTAIHLFPSANHTRFEHSLGVMKLAVDYFDALNFSFTSIYKNEIKYIDIESELYFLKKHLKYAALLHDVGHAPLSHVGEAHYDVDSISNKILDISKDEKIKMSTSCFEKGSPHEKMSVYIILKNFREILDSFYKFDYEFIARIITGCKYEQLEYWDRNIIIDIINSGTLDVDKLDYLLRDNKMTGYVGPDIDLKRLIQSLEISSNKKIVYKTVALSSLQKIIDCRDSLYMWVYNHHTVVYSDFLHYEILNHFNNLKNEYPGNFNEELDLDDLFSCKAISELKTTDSEVQSVIRKALINSSKEKSKTSDYTKKLTEQLLNRNFLKPLWKTLFDFTKYVNENFDDSEKPQILEFINGKNDKDGKNNRSKIVKSLLKKTNLKLGDIFIVNRSNKFYGKKISEFYLYIDGRNVALSKLLPLRDYDKIYDKIAFYVYTKPDKIDLVKEELPLVLKEIIEFK